MTDNKQIVREALDVVMGLCLCGTSEVEYGCSPCETVMHGYAALENLTDTAALIERLKDYKIKRAAIPEAFAINDTIDVIIEELKEKPND